MTKIIEPKLNEIHSPQQGRLIGSSKEPIKHEQILFDSFFFANRR